MGARPLEVFVRGDLSLSVSGQIVVVATHLVGIDGGRGWDAQPGHRKENVLLIRF